MTVNGIKLVTQHFTRRFSLYLCVGVWDIDDFHMERRGLVITAMALVFITLSVIIAVYTDLRWMIIPDWLTYSMIMTGLGYSLISGDPVQSLISMLFAGVLFFIPALFGQVGMGDVKWMAGIGAWTSIPFVVLSFASASVIGLFYVLGTLIWKLVIKKRKYKEARKEPIPYGVSLGGGIISGLLVVHMGFII